MAKSKIYTYQKFGDLLRDFLQEVAPDKIQPAALHEYTNLGVLDLCERLNSASAPDYMKTAVLNESSKTPNTLQVGVTYVDATKTVTKAPHGLTAANIGQRVVLAESDAATGALIALHLTEIVSVPTTGTFTIKNGIDAANTYIGGEATLPLGGETLGYITFPLTAYTTNKLDCDISAINLDKIVKIVDSVNGLVVSPGDAEIEGIVYFSAALPGNSMKQGNVWYTQNGETISLYKGTSVSAYGTLTMHYYEQPTLLGTSDPLTTYVDVRDKFIPLLFAIVKNLLYEQLQKQAPDSLTAMIAAKTADIRASNKEETAALKDRAKK